MTKLAYLALTILALSGKARAFELKSKDIKVNSQIGEDFAFQGMGCTGKNQSPELTWSNAPKETKSFAVTVYDPDAPTGSGWWHWVVIDIPADKTSLSRGIKLGGADGLEIASDFGSANYGGPCPPPGKPHHYIFTVHALKTTKLDLPAGASNAYARFLIESQSIARATLRATYARGK